MTTQVTRRNPRAMQLPESVVQVWLAGLGALALTEQEGMRFFRSLVKRGESVERDAMARLERAMAAARAASGATMARVEAGVEDTRNEVLHRLGVPTQRELNQLSRRIEGITTTARRPAATRRTATKRTRSTTATRRKTATAASRRKTTATGRSRRKTATASA